MDASETDITEQVVYYVTLMWCVPLVCYLIFTASNLNAKNKPETVPLTSLITEALYKLKETYSWSLLFSEQLPGFSQQADFGSEGFLWMCLSGSYIRYQLCCGFVCISAQTPHLFYLFYPFLTLLHSTKWFRITHVCVCLHVKKQLLPNCVSFRFTVEVICVVLKLVVILLVSFCWAIK